MCSKSFTSMLINFDQYVKPYVVEYKFTFITQMCTETVAYFL